MSQAESETVDGEREKHSDAHASSPTREARRRHAAIAVGGLLLANILYKRYRHLVVLWI